MSGITLPAFKTDPALQEIEQRQFYGFWDFGDVMHTYGKAVNDFIPAEC